MFFLPDRPRHCPLAGCSSPHHFARTAPPDATPSPPGSTPLLPSCWAVLLSTAICRPAFARFRTSACLILLGAGPRHGRQVLLRALLRDARQQSAHLSLPVPAVTAERPDRGELPCLGPSRDSLRIHPEHRCYLGRREQRLGLRCACRHCYGLSSWTGTAILRFVAVFWPP